MPNSPELIRSDVERWHRVLTEIGSRSSLLKDPAELSAFDTLRTHWRGSRSPDLCERKIEILRKNYDKHPSGNAEERILLESLKDFVGLCRRYYTKTDEEFRLFKSELEKKPTFRPSSAPSVPASSPRTSMPVTTTQPIGPTPFSRTPTRSSSSLGASGPHTTGVTPPTYLLQSVACLIVFFCPYVIPGILAIVAIARGSKVSSFATTGNFRSALAASASAMRWMLSSLIIGISFHLLNLFVTSFPNQVEKSIDMGDSENGSISLDTSVIHDEVITASDGETGIVLGETISTDLPVEPTSTPLSIGQPPASNEGIMETWTDTQGRTLEAALVHVNGTNAEFRTADGLIHKIPLSGLSLESRARTGENAVTMRYTDPAPGGGFPASEPAERLEAWTDTEGKKAFATLIRSTGTSVIIRTADGRLHDIPLSRLSPESRERAKRTPLPEDPTTEILVVYERLFKQIITGPDLTVPQTAALFAAANAGDNEAAALVGESYYDGLDTFPVNRVEALKWFVRSAKGQHPLGRHWIAVMTQTGEIAASEPPQALFQNALPDLIDIVAHQDPAAPYWRAAAECYAGGQGIELSERQPRELLEKAIERDDARARLLRGNMLLVSNSSVGASYLRYSSDAGCATASTSLAKYYLGEGMQPPRAPTLLRVAALKNDIEAQTLLGYCLATGTGTASDRAESAFWLQLGLLNSIRFANKKLEAEARRSIGTLTSAVGEDHINRAGDFLRTKNLTTERSSTGP